MDPIGFAYRMTFLCLKNENSFKPFGWQFFLPQCRKKIPHLFDKFCVSQGGMNKSV